MNVITRAGLERGCGGKLQVFAQQYMKGKVKVFSNENNLLLSTCGSMPLWLASAP